jgi:hypothetical protein
VSGSTQVVNFNSNPDEASVIINGYSRGRTPLAVDSRHADAEQVARVPNTVNLGR